MRDMTLEDAKAEIAFLQELLDSRPAINAGLPETYIKWSQGIYVIEARGAMLGKYRTK